MIESENDLLDLALLADQHRVPQARLDPEALRRRRGREISCDLRRPRPAGTVPLTLQEVARVFAETGITGAPVVAGRELVGVVSTTDLVEFEQEVVGSEDEAWRQVEKYWRLKLSVIRDLLEKVK